MPFRVVVHGLPDRSRARVLATEIIEAAAGWSPLITIEPDDAETAMRPGGAATEWVTRDDVSLRKDTPRKGAHL